MQSSNTGPIYSTIQERITQKFNPTILEISNDSHKHRHHAAMKGSSNPETHFSVKIVSDDFKDMRVLERQRLVFSLFKNEMETPGMLHALSLVTRTVEEENRATNK
ncbi:hypothetical protein BB558_004908 [Smittium angustum]|nr:hypothetical protein BB558_004908 [Smittium angustum]